MTDDRSYGWASGAALPYGQDAPVPQQLFDVELGQIFLRLRTFLGLSLWDMARAVGGEPTVIADLEAGAIGALPPWPELTRLVDAYASLTGVDTQPIMARLLRAQPSAPPYGPASVARTVTMTGPPLVTLPTPPYRPGSAMSGRGAARADVPTQAFGASANPLRDAASPKAPRRYGAAPALATTTVEATGRTAPALTGRGLQKSARSIGRGAWRFVKVRAALLVTVLVVPALLAVTARLAPDVLYRVISPLPALVATPLRSGVDAAVAVLAPVRDGLTWVEVGDARIRKTDKLSVPPR